MTNSNHSLDSNTSLRNGYMSIRNGLSNMSAGASAVGVEFVTRLYEHLAKGATFDGSTREFLQKYNDFNSSIDSAQQSTLESIKDIKNTEDELKQSDYVKDFNDLFDRLSENDNYNFKNKIKDIQQRFQSRQDEIDALATDKSQFDQQNRSKLMTRVASTLIFSGAFEILEILTSLIDCFGASSDFPDGVQKALSDSKVFSFFADIFDALEIDQIGKGLAKIPPFSDINQLATETLQSEYVQPFAGIGHELIANDMTNLALKIATFSHYFYDFYSDSQRSNKLTEESDKEFKSIHKKIKENQTEYIDTADKASINILKKTQNLCELSALFEFKDNAQDPIKKELRDLLSQKKYKDLKFTDKNGDEKSIIDIDKAELDEMVKLPSNQKQLDILMSFAKDVAEKKLADIATNSTQPVSGRHIYQDLPTKKAKAIEKYVAKINKFLEEQGKDKLQDGFHDIDSEDFKKINRQYNEMFFLKKMERDKETQDAVSFAPTTLPSAIDPNDQSGHQVKSSSPPDRPIPPTPASASAKTSPSTVPAPGGRPAPGATTGSATRIAGPINVSSVSVSI